MPPLDVDDLRVGAVRKYKDNWTASVPPGVGDDADDGYGTGSMWLDTTASPRELYVCRNAASGAAVWDKVARQAVVDNLVTNDHTHSNKAQLDLVSDGDHDVRTDNPHAVTAAQAGAEPSGAIATHASNASAHHARYTNAEAVSAMGAKADGNPLNHDKYSHPNHTGDVTSVGDGAQTIANNAVTNAKLADVATSTIKGRVTAATGDPEDLTATQVRTLLNVAEGANNYTHPNHTGDVTSVGDGAQTIANNAVTNAKAADMAAYTVKLRNAGTTGDPGDTKVSGLTTKVPVSGDWIMGEASTGELRKFDVGALPGGGGPTVFSVAETSLITRTLDTFAVISGMTLTPGAGTYVCIFSSSVKVDKNGVTGILAIFNNGTIIQSSEREGGGQANNRQGLTCVAVTTVSAGQALDVRWKLSTISAGPTMEMDDRTLVLIKTA